MFKTIDITGQRFGRLVAKRQDGKIGDNTAWLCDCDCGETRRVCSSSLRAGRTKSCGCLQKETARDHAIKNQTGIAERLGFGAGKEEHNLHACFYCVKSPDGVTYTFRNLRHFVRTHAELFPPGYADEPRMLAFHGLHKLFLRGESQRESWHDWQGVWKKDRLGRIVWEKT